MSVFPYLSHHTKPKLNEHTKKRMINLNKISFEFMGISNGFLIYFLEVLNSEVLDIDRNHDHQFEWYRIDLSTFLQLFCCLEVLKIHDSLNSMSERWTNISINRIKKPFNWIAYDQIKRILKTLMEIWMSFFGNWFQRQRAIVLTEFWSYQRNWP